MKYISLTSFLIATMAISGCFVFQSENIDADTYTQSGPTAGANVYRDTNYGFRIDWLPFMTLDAKTNNEIPYVLIADDSIGKILILPRGEMDFGLPFSEPDISTLQLNDGGKATMKKWKLENNALLAIVTFADAPRSWTSSHRVQVEASDNQIDGALAIVKSISFE